jgi:hypothetical protein
MKFYNQRVSIIIGRLSASNISVYTTKYNRWYTKDRKHLFSNLKYTELKIVKNDYGIYKMGLSIENSILKKLLSTKMIIGN